MAFQEVAGAKSFVKANGMNPGDVMVTGWFVGERPSKFGGKDFEFETEDGKHIVVNKSGQLVYAMQFVEKGDFVRVTYVGKNILDKGTFKGREAHQFKVEKDPGRRRAVSPNPTSVASETPEVLDNPLY